MKRLFFFFVIFSFFAADFFSEENSSSESEDAWILAAKEFSLEKNLEYSSAVRAAASVIPKLILEQISIDTRRTVFRDELVSQKLDSLLNERLALFLELSREVKARDALVLNNYTMAEYQAALKKQEKKILDVQKKIDSNLREEENVLHPDNIKKRKEIKNAKKLFEARAKPVSLYKNSSESLFEAADKNAAIDSRTFAKEISSAKISGLITGSIAAYGNYISVSAELCVFPAAKKIASAVEVGSVGDARRIAQNIAFSFLPKIANSLPVEIEFKIFPEEALQDAELTIDNIVYTSIPERAVVASGFHSVSIEAKNFGRESFLYDFSGEGKFFVEVNLQEESEGSVKLALSKFVPGEMFFAGKFAGESSPSDFSKVPVKVNGKTVFGYFEGTVKDKSKDGGEKTETMFLMIPQDLAKDGSELETSMRVIDVGKNIDKRRKMLYVSYSALLLSLPFMFCCYGKFTSLQNAYVLDYGSVSYDELVRYRNLSFAGIGITSACGVWMVAELVAYLCAVEKVFPSKARPVKSKTLRKMEYERALEEERLLQEKAQEENAENSEGEESENSEGESQIEKTEESERKEGE